MALHRKIFKGYLILLSGIALTSSAVVILNPHQFRAKIEKIATFSVVALITSVEFYAIGAMVGAAQKRTQVENPEASISLASTNTFAIQAASVAPDELKNYYSEIPLACQGCADYCGQVFHRYNPAVGVTGEKFVCAIHPYGPGDISDPSKQPSDCPDFRARYVIVRIQGFPRSGLWLIRKEGTVASSMANAVGIDECEIQSLLTYFKRKSPNGLPGCEFMSRYRDVEQALEELLTQAVEEEVGQIDAL